MSTITFALLSLLSVNEAIATPYHNAKEQLAVDCLDFMSAAQAYNFIHANDWNGLLGRVNDAIEKNPDKPRLYDIRGRIYCALKQYQLAEADFNTAIQLAPKNPVLYEHRSGLYTGIGNNSRAASDRKVLNQLKPDWDKPLGSKASTSNIFSIAWSAVVLIVVVGVPILFMFLRSNRSTTGTPYKAIGDR